MSPASWFVTAAVVVGLFLINIDVSLGCRRYLSAVPRYLWSDYNCRHTCIFDNAVLSARTFACTVCCMQCNSGCQSLLKLSCSVFAFLHHFQQAACCASDCCLCRSVRTAVKWNCSGSAVNTYTDHIPLNIVAFEVWCYWYFVYESSWLQVRHCVSNVILTLWYIQNQWFNNIQFSAQWDNVT